MGSVRWGFVARVGAVTALVVVVGVMVIDRISSRSSAPSENADLATPVELLTDGWETVADLFDEADWVLSLVPDTQVYSQSYPEIFEAQTRWISDRADDLGIEMVIHLGDIVESFGEDELEWERAASAWSLLTVPAWLVVGNHDMGPGGESPGFAEHFPWPEDAAWFGGHNGGRSAHVNVRDHLIVTLEFCPTSETVDWAGGVIDAHDGPVILATHAFLAAADRRSSCIHDHSEGDHDGERIWCWSTRRTGSPLQPADTDETGSLMARTDSERWRHRPSRRSPRFGRRPMASVPICT